MLHEVFHMNHLHRRLKQTVSERVEEESQLPIVLFILFAVTFFFPNFSLSSSPKILWRMFSYMSQ